jgi:tetratricopeptide (TPR) repeat protein
MLSTVLEGQKLYDKALRVLEEGLKQDPANAELLFRTGVVLDKAGEKEKCLGQMRKVLEIKPDHADALNYIGYTFAEQGIRLDEAQELIEKALKLKPESGYILDSLGWVYYQKGKLDEAVRTLEKAASLVPNDPTIAEHLGDAYFAKKDYRKALQMYEKALSFNPPTPETVKEKIEKTRRKVQ